MPTKDRVEIRPLGTDDDLTETRLEAVGFIFHGTLSSSGTSPVRAGTNLLHFARCSKIDRARPNEHKIWYRTIRIAKAHLDEHVGDGRWKWCKLCEREITQRVLNEV